MAFSRRLAVLASICLVAFGAPAAAQYPGAQPAPEEVAAARNCLCLEQAVQDRRFELDVRNGLFEKLRADADALEREVDRRRTSVNVDDQNQIDAFRALLDQRDAARKHYETTAVPEQQQTVARYNAAVGALNAACAGRSYSTYAWEAARKGPVCPRN